MIADEGTDLLLPEKTRLVHIGPQKTGSTALQAAVHSRRDEIRQYGVTSVGTARRERQALWAALMHHDSVEERYRQDFARWDAMRERMASADGRVFLSNESLGKADSDGARRMARALGGERAHIVAVARRLDRLLPSQWQQLVKSHATTRSYPEWLEIVLGDHPGDHAWRNIWGPHDIEGLVSRWTDATSPERFTLIVADETDKRLLSRTIEGMLGLPHGLLRPDTTHKSNASLSYGRLEVVRLLNKRLASADAALGAAVEHQLPARLIRAVKLDAPRPDEQRIPELPEWARERVEELSEARAKLVSSLNVRVIGDPEHLRVPIVDVATPAETVGPSTAMVSSELAARAIAESLALAREREGEVVAELEQELERLRRRLRRLDSAERASHLSGRELLAELSRRIRRRLGR